MRKFIILGTIIATVSLSGAAFAQRELDKVFSRIPPISAAKQNVLAEYRFSVNYITADEHGEPAKTERVVGIFVLNAATGVTKWQSVVTAMKAGAPSDIVPTEHQRHMEGMQYDASANPFASDFFKGFPPQAIQERNLVWDMHMFNAFIRETWDKLQPNVAVPFTSGDVPLGGSGTFHNKDIQLTWVGVSRQNGRNCALVCYEAFLNTFTTSVPGFKVVGRSEYWGDM